MDNPSSEPTAQKLPTSEDPLGPWNAFFKTLKPKSLRKASRPKNESERDEIVAQIKASSERQQIAFEILYALQDLKLSSKLEWLEDPMLELLGGGENEPDLAAKSVPSEAKTWVYREFKEVRNQKELKRFLASGRHLWVFHVILKAASNKQVLVEALTALTECFEHCLNTKEDGTPNKVAIHVSDGAWISKLLKSQIPAKGELPKSFQDALFAITATAQLSDELRKDSNSLHFKLKETESELAQANQSKKSAEERADDLQQQLDEIRSQLTAARKDLEEEKLHSTRKGGFNTVAKSETINRVMATVRQGVSHRLKDIRAYADRDNPDREEIVSLVGEIEKHIGGIEANLKQ